MKDRASRFSKNKSPDERMDNTELEKRDKDIEKLVILHDKAFELINKNTSLKPSIKDRLRSQHSSDYILLESEIYKIIKIETKGVFILRLFNIFSIKAIKKLFLKPA